MLYGNNYKASERFVFPDITPLTDIGIMCEHAAPYSFGFWYDRKGKTGTVQNAVVFNALSKYALGA